MNEIPEVVFSRTLDRAHWPESRIARGDLAEEIAELKREPGKEMIEEGNVSEGAAPSQQRAPLKRYSRQRSASPAHSSSSAATSSAHC